MNNVVFGNDRFTYYETIGGGQGACPSADGPSAVHVAMSNTLNTRSRRSSRVPPAWSVRFRRFRRAGAIGW
jgi:N-methylhydantoinase B